jgi:AraC-like DNA-binding protein
MASGYAIPASELSALRRCRLFACDDIDEAHDRIAAVLQPHRLNPLGVGRRMRNHMDVIALPGIRIGGLAFGHSRVEVPALDGYHLLVFCLSGRATIRTEDGVTEINPLRAVSCAPGQPFGGEFSDDCEQLVLRIDQAAMQAHAGTRHRRLAPAIDLTSPSAQPWLTLLRNLVGSEALLRTVQADRCIATSYEGLLLRLLLSGPGQEEAGNSHRAQPLPGSVHRAEAFIAAHALEALTLEDIACAARTPARTLLDAFRRFRSTSPMQHLRRVRLDHARARLRLEDSRTVAEIALDCGFGHLGRFARDYALAFGERPSETRRLRGEGRAAVSGPE